MSMRAMGWVLLLCCCSATAGQRWPADQAVLPTTAGGIYLGNLDARIGVVEAMRQRAPDAANAAQLAGLLYHRYRIRGALADAERAFELADAAVAGPDAAPDAYLLRATLRSGFHRFAEVAADLDAAAASGARPELLRRARQDLALSLGRYDALAPAFAAARAGLGEDFDTLAFHAHLRALHGDLAGSEALYARAQAAYADSSPVGLAWLYVQQGVQLLEAGAHARAGTFFEAARARLPGYTLATEHLAETEALLGNAARARALYREAIADSGDPAFIDALASLEAAAGNEALAARLALQARDGWERRLARHPQAFAAHAIDYFLAQGDTARARALALDNAAARRDIDSLVALAETERAAGNPGAACARWREATATGLSPAVLRTLSWSGDCRQRAAE